LATILLFSNSWYVEEASSFLGNILPEVQPQEVLAATLQDGFAMKITPQTKRGDRSNMSEVLEYSVEEGDNITKIATRFGLKPETILWANGLNSANYLKIGQKLTILPVDGILYTVGKSEDLKKIAEKYKIDAKLIIKQNNFSEDIALATDQKIIIPGGKLLLIAPINKKSYIASYNAFGTLMKPKNAEVKPYIGKKMIKPASGIYTTYFGQRRGHFAVDIAAIGGGPIWAATAGKVIKVSSGWSGGYGNEIVIDHGNGVQTLYGHLKKFYVREGDQVARGQQIGEMGNTGRVYGRSGIHLHFEVIDHGIKRNPLAYY